MNGRYPDTELRVLCAGREGVLACPYHAAKAHVIDRMQLLMRSA